MAESENESPTSNEGILRREVLSGSGIAMAGGLVTSYGTLALYAGRYLYPAGPQAKSWVYVTDLRSMKEGDSLEWESPIGEKIIVARQRNNGDRTDFIALSSVCPHLGCQVHWQPHKDRFFCPCHNGVFTPEGKGIEGPPAQAGQSLAEYPLDVRNGLLFIEVATEGLTMPEKA